MSTVADTTSRAVDAAAPYAGLWRRAAALIIDYVVLVVLLVVGLVGIRFLPLPQDTRQIVLLFLFLGVLLFYYALFECSSYRATPGKLAMRIEVCDLAGNKLSFGRAFGRNIGKIFSTLSMNVGYAMVVFTRKRQTLHDKMARALVVRRGFRAEQIAGAPEAPRVPVWAAVIAIVAFVALDFVARWADGLIRGAAGQ